MMSFDVKSLCTSILLNKTIEITLERIHDRIEINTNIPKLSWRKCYYYVHFLYEDEIYQQNDGVGMGSPLGPIHAGFLMVELETKIVPTLGNLLRKWKRYVDATCRIVQTDSVNEILLKLNSFYINTIYIWSWKQ